jgi:3-methyladenine DNA glycosylase AlkD
MLKDKLSAGEIKTELRRVSDPAKAEILKRFFKTGPGQYGEGDKFLGVVVPDIRRIAKHFISLPLTEVQILLSSPYHEERLTGLIILTYQFVSADEVMRGKIYRLYLKNTKQINNWDLVDLSAPNVVGAYLQDKDRAILYRLARSKNLWEKRIAMLSTFQYIKVGDIYDALRISEILLADSHDLIHKAVGWMLREVGKRASEKELKKFLDTHGKKMPRTMLRYAIERLPEGERQKYLKM